MVIPESIREKLELKTGDHFVVVGQGDVVMLKVITPPSIDEYEELKKQLQNQARNADLKKSDIKSAIRQARAN
ncbi:type II toxin-antitoxin system PrlF family antitoxin [bacterium]|nr:type II toxin-antitoxin system PrlF family antitoxin [bacterium]